MTKEEFEKKLREKLNLLEEDEINDIVEEYLGYIEEKMQNGATEEDAIKDFGDIDELAKELLKAYKINVEHSSKEKNWINIFADKFVMWMDQIVKVFSNKSATEIIKIMIEIGIIILLICLCKIPFLILEDIGFNMFNVFQNHFGLALFKIWKLLLEFIYLISAIILFAKIFEKRYLSEEKYSEKRIKVMEKKSNKKIEDQEKVTEKIIIEKEPQKGFIDMLSTMCLWFIKFIVFWILFGVGCYILGIGMCLGVCVYLLIRGVTYYGIYLSVLMLLILGIILFIILFNFIANRKNNVKFLMISFLTSFLLLGISFSAASLEITTTEYINDIPDFYQSETINESIPMDEDYYIGRYVEFIEDETLQQEIKFEYTYYPDYYKIKPNIQIQRNNIYVNYSFINHTWNAKILEGVIKNLKDRKVYNYNLAPQIKVYTSRKNIEKLKENKKKSNQSKSNQNKIYNFCIEEVIIEEEHELYDYCQKIINPIDNTKDF